MKEFLLQVIVKPVPIDSYQPPITKILRDHHKSYIDEVNSKKIQKELKVFFLDNIEISKCQTPQIKIY